MSSMSSFQIALALSAGAVLTPELSQPVNSGVSLIQTVDTVEESIDIQKLKAELEQLRKENEELKKQKPTGTAQGSAQAYVEKMHKQRAALLGDAAPPLLDGIHKAGGAPSGAALGGGNPLLAGIQKAGGKPSGNPMSMNMAAIRNGISKNNEAAGAPPKSTNMAELFKEAQRAKASQKSSFKPEDFEAKLKERKAAEQAEKQGQAAPWARRKNNGEEVTFPSNNKKHLGNNFEHKKEALPKKPFTVPVAKKTPLEMLKAKATTKGKKEVVVKMAYFDDFLRSVDNLTYLSKSAVKSAFMDFVKKVNNDRLN